MKSHAASIETSRRLQKLLRALQRGGYFTTAALQDMTSSMAIHSDIHELRRNGKNIHCKYFGIMKDRKIYGYALKGGEK